MEVLGPLPLHDRPQSLDGVELAAVGGEEVLLEVIVVDIVQLLRVVDPQVVQHHHHSPSLALVLHSLHEVHEKVGVVALDEDLEVHEAPLLAKGTIKTRTPTVTQNGGEQVQRGHIRMPDVRRVPGNAQPGEFRSEGLSAFTRRELTGLAGNPNRLQGNSGQTPNPLHFTPFLLPLQPSHYNERHTNTP